MSKFINFIFEDSWEYRYYEWRVAEPIWAYKLYYQS